MIRMRMREHEGGWGCILPSICCGGASGSLVLVLLVPALGLMLAGAHAAASSGGDDYDENDDTCDNSRHGMAIIQNLQYSLSEFSMLAFKIKSQFSKSILQSSADHSQSLDSVSLETGEQVCNGNAVHEWPGSWAFLAWVNVSASGPVYVYGYTLLIQHIDIQWYLSGIDVYKTF